MIFIVGRCIPYVTHTQYNYKTEDKFLYRRKKKKKLINKNKEIKKECRIAKIRNISYKHFYNLTNQFTLLTLLAKRLIKKKRSINLVSFRKIYLILIY